MNRRDYLKASSSTLLLSAIAGCSSAVDSYYEPELDSLEQIDFDYENIRSNRVILLQRHSSIVDSYGCNITVEISTDTVTEEIEFKKHSNIDRSLFTKITTPTESAKEQIDLFSTISTYYYRIQRENLDAVEYSQESTQRVHLFSGESILLNWLDNISVTYEGSESMNNTTLHRYTITSFNGNPVKNGLLAVNDRGIILEANIETEDSYSASFKLSDVNSVEFERPTWISNATESKETPEEPEYEPRF